MAQAFASLGRLCPMHTELLSSNVDGSAAPARRRQRSWWCRVIRLAVCRVLAGSFFIPLFCYLTLNGYVTVMELWMTENLLSHVSSVAFLCFYNVITLLMYLCYFRCVFGNPGVVDSDFQEARNQWLALET